MQQIEHKSHKISPRESKEDGPENQIDKARELVTNFAETVFNNHLPQEITDRLNLLHDPTRLVADEDIINKKLSGTKSDENVQRTAGFYDPVSDRIYIRGSISRGTIIHEMLHFVSAYPEDTPPRLGLLDMSKNITMTDVANNFLRPQEHDLTNTKPNEAITQMLTIAIDEGIDLKNPFAFYRLYNHIQTLRLSGGLEVADSYKDFLLNSLEFFRKLNADGLISEVGKNYLLADKVGFDHMLTARTTALSKLFGDDKLVPEKFYQQTGQEGRDAREQIQTLLEVTYERMRENGSIPEIYKAAAKQFIDALSSKKYNVSYVHPENRFSPNSLVAIDPRYESKKHAFVAPAKIDIDTSIMEMTGVVILEDGKQGELPLTYLCQLQAYLIWAGLKLRHINDTDMKIDADFEGDGIRCIDKNGNPVDFWDDYDFFHSKEMQEYLSYLSAWELEKVVKMAHVVLRKELRDKDARDVFRYKKDRGDYNERPLEEYDIIDSMELEGSIVDVLYERGLGYWDVIRVGNNFLIPKGTPDHLEKVNEVSVEDNEINS